MTESKPLTYTELDDLDALTAASATLLDVRDEDEWTAATSAPPSTPP